MQFASVMDIGSKFLSLFSDVMAATFGCIQCLLQWVEFLVWGKILTHQSLSIQVLMAPSFVCFPQKYFGVPTTPQQSQTGEIWIFGLHRQNQIYFVCQ